MYVCMYIHVLLCIYVQVSVVALKAWSNVVEMLEDRVITKEQLDEIVGDVADGKKQ
jgi:hypothetical protein